MIKVLLIILSILPVNLTLATENIASAEPISPDVAALHIVRESLMSLKKLGDKKQLTTNNVKKIINTQLLPNLAIKIATQISLKKHWADLTTQQQRIFQKYITKSLIADYAGALGAYKNINDIQMSVNPKIKRKGNKALVKILLSVKKATYEVTLKMIYSTQWRIYDVVFSGISLLKNYQSEFNAHIRRKGIESLIQKIDRRLKKG